MFSLSLQSHLCLFVLHCQLAPAPFALVVNPNALLAREKASSCTMHQNVLAQVDATSKGNKQKLSDKKTDVLLTRPKW
jgi:hypothetical protein